MASLQHFLREHDVEELFVGGFATDEAVLHTVLDCRTQLPDIEVFVLEDLCAAASEEAGRVRRLYLQLALACLGRTLPASIMLYPSRFCQ